MLNQLIAQENLEELKAEVLGSRQTTDKVFLLLRQIEAHLKTQPDQVLSFDSRGVGTLDFRGQTWQTGRFETPTLAELKSALPKLSKHSYTFHVFLGGNPLTDIGTLQSRAPEHTLFQVASQFNGLESTGPFITPVTRYLNDPTQGPRAAISAYPGTFHRHYGARTTSQGLQAQSDDWELNFLDKVLPPGAVRHGYMMAETLEDPEDTLHDLTTYFDQIKVGIQAETEVALGYNWTGKVSGSPKITQVLTSTFAAGHYSPQLVPQNATFRGMMSQLLKAAYLGTLLAAAKEQCKQVVLTPIGGGVFGNPSELIWEAILWALNEAQPHLNQDTLVVLNSYIWGHDILLDKFDTDLLPFHGKVLQF